MPRCREAVRKYFTALGGMHRYHWFHLPYAHQWVHGILPIPVVRQRLLHGVYWHPSLSGSVLWPSDSILAGSLGMEVRRRGPADGIARDPRGRGTGRTIDVDQVVRVDPVEGKALTSNVPYDVIHVDA